MAKQIYKAYLILDCFWSILAVIIRIYKDIGYLFRMECARLNAFSIVYYLREYPYTSLV